MDLFLSQEKVAVLGIVIGIMLSLSPVPTFIDIAVHSKSTGGYTVAPYISSLTTCSLWLLYAFVAAKAELIPLNVVSFVVYAVYCGVFLFYAPLKTKVLQMYFWALLLVAGGAVIAVLTKSVAAVGVIAIFANCVMFAAPLAVIQLVTQTKSVRYMPFLLSLFSFLCALVWLTWAVIVSDYFVMIPNGLGAIFGVVQILVYGYYWKYGQDGANQANLIEDELTPMAKPVVAVSQSSSFGNQRTALE